MPYNQLYQPCKLAQRYDRHSKASLFLGFPAGKQQVGTHTAHRFVCKHLDARVAVCRVCRTASTNTVM